MGRLIDESLLQEKLALIPMEERTFRRTVEELENAPTVEAIPKDQYIKRLKADMVAMLEELKKEIVEITIPKATVSSEIFWNMGADAMKEEIGTRIQEKINSLKEENK